jgi:hypothetical protein
MEDIGELTPEERAAFRRDQRQRKAKKQRESQEKAKRLTDWFRTPNRPMPK